MNYGMLWFDNDPDTNLTKKVQRAVAYYHKKYGGTPDLCIVNPAMLAEKKTSAGEVEVEGSSAILPNHFWIGRRGL